MVLIGHMLNFLKINRIAFFFIVLLACIISMNHACVSASDKSSNKSVFRLNESNGISSLDPAFAKDLSNLNVCNQLYNGLVQLDSAMQIQPAIAKAWEISADGKIYTFHLRNDVFFHDNKAFADGKGRKVCASDFIYSFQRILNPQVLSPGAWVFNSVKKEEQGYAFSAPNDTTLIIELEHAYTPFLSILSMQYCNVLPFEAVQYYGEEFRKNPVGTGPFYLKYWEEDVKLVLLKNPNYFEKSKEQSLPYLDAINYSFIVDKQAEFLEFIQGNLDYMSGIEPAFKDEILDQTGQVSAKYKQEIRLQKNPYLNTEYIGILYDTSANGVDQSPLKYLKFRQALNYAIDKKKMLRYLRNSIGIPGERGFLPVAYSFNNIGYGYAYDKVKAHALIDELKQELHVSELPSITLVATSKSIDIAKFVQHQLAQIDVQMEVELMQWAAMKEVVANSKAQFFRGSWIADYPDAENYLSLFYTANFSPKGPNYTHFSNPYYDSLYLRSVTIADLDVKQKLYRAMDSLIMENAVIIPLYYDEVMRFTHKDMENLPKSPMNILDLKWVKKKEK